MRMVGLSLTLALSLLAAQSALAGDCGVPPCGPAGCGAGCASGSASKCAHCGQECVCAQKTCKLVCGKEKYKKYCWEVKCEEFCPLLPTLGGCQDCGECGGQGCDSCQAQPTCGTPACGGEAGKCGEKCPSPNYVTPHCGKTRVKKTLVKKEYECERPTFKCVVQYLCPACSAQCDACGGQIPAAAPAPAPGPAPTPAPAPNAPLPDAPKSAAFFP